jgi:hypothetical protein
VESFPETMKKLFEDVIEKFQYVFQFVEDFPRIIGDFFSDLVDAIVDSITILG